jgi:3-dehydroquinate synthase
MVGFRVSSQIKIKSHKGEYSAKFIRGGMDQLNRNPIEDAIYLIDQNIAKLYAKRLNNILSARVLIIKANETNKSLSYFPNYIKELVKLNIKRGQMLVAIGGGVIQDITCFLATTLMRGLPWAFYPTTLLAQADSCIGSKSSINSGDIKNILGTFTPPKFIVIDIDFLQTLKTKEIYSGIGEMIKVHAINSPKSFDKIASSYEKIIVDFKFMENYIHNSLLMKKKLIEDDEFDTGPRNIMNYGHSFGHAIETATNYKIPHGIAVTIGMDLANFFAADVGVSTWGHFERMHSLLEKNCYSFRHIRIDSDLLVAALKKDKKNSATQLRLILPNKNGDISIVPRDNNKVLSKSINKYFTKYSKAV